MKAVIIKPKSLVVCDYELLVSRNKKLSEVSLLNLEKKHTLTDLQYKTTKRIEQILYCWFRAINSRKINHLIYGHCQSVYPVFLTLTLPSAQVHDDKYIKRKVFTPFLEELKRVHKVVHYLYRCEKQKNGNIHFHVIIDKYINVRCLIDCWNRHLQKLSYLSMYQAIWGNKLPHNVDVRRITSLKSLSVYLTKYMVKDSDNHVVMGRKWGCSDRLRLLKYNYELLDSSLKSYIDYLVLSEKAVVHKLDYCDVISFTKKFDYDYDFSYLNRIEMNYYVQLYNELYVYDSVPFERDLIAVNETVMLNELNSVANNVQLSLMFDVPISLEKMSERNYL